MGVVILNILAAVGKGLLILLLVLVILIALLLFVPFCYRGRFSRTEEKTHASLRLSWLFVVLRAVVRYESDGAARAEVYLLGIPLLRLIGWIRGRKARRAERTASRKRHKQRAQSAASKRPAKERASEAQPKEAAREAHRTDPAVSAGAQRRERTPVRPSVPPKREQRGEAEKTSGNFLSKIKSIYGKIKSIWELLRSDSFRGAFRAVKEHGLAMLRHIRPRRIEGALWFGFSDPARTGQVLAVLALVYGFAPRGLRVRPDFTDSRLEADLRFRGHFFLIYLLIRVIKLYRTKELRSILRRMRHGRTKQK